MNSDAIIFPNISVLQPVFGYGDVHVTPDGLYFVIYQQSNVVKATLAMHFGLLGAYYAQRAKKKREQTMTQLRLDNAGMFPADLIVRYPGSWFVPREQLKLFKYFLGTVTIERVTEKKVQFSLAKAGWEKLQFHGRANGWPLKK